MIDALEIHDGAIAAHPVTDTLKRARGSRGAATVDRAGLWLAQTPQGFRFAAILAAHRRAAAEGVDANSREALNSRSTPSLRGR